MTYRDGSTAVVRSGPGWKASDGPTRFDDFLYGETYDARRAADLSGWATPEYDDAAWSGARASSGPTGVLEAQDVEPIRPQEQLAFRSVRETEPGVYLFDLGENIAGNAILDTDLPEGREITLRYGEKLRDNGRVENCLIPGICIGMDYQSDRYVGGPGRDVWRPEFSYKGFQYVEVEGLTAPPDVSMLRAEVWHTDAREIGSFESSNGLLDRIVRNTRRAVLSNLMGMPTDTPIYEKTGYTGDGLLMAPSNSYLFDLRRFYAKWTVDIRQSQAPATGELPVWAPSPTDPNGPSNDNPSFPGPSPGWDAALFVVPDVLLRFYGEDRPARQALEEMRKYRAWYDRHALSNGILVEGCPNPTGEPCPNGLGDWSNPTGTVKGVTLDNTAWYFHMLGLMERIATLAGDEATATSARERAAQVFQAFQERFWNPATQTYRNDPGQTVFSQHQNAIALGLGLVPADRIQAVGDALAADVRARGNHLATGIMGTRFLWHALTMTGHLDEAFAVATQTTYPSYGYWIDELGWTSLGENWEADTRSRNHHMFGTIVQWMFDTLAGYKPLKPGYKQIEYRPMIPTTGLDWVRASTDTVRGRVATHWRKVGRGLNLDIKVPANASGLVYIPADRPGDVFESGTGRLRSAHNARGVQLVGREGDRIVYRVGSGTTSSGSVRPASEPQRARSLHDKGPGARRRATGHPRRGASQRLAHGVDKAGAVAARNERERPCHRAARAQCHWSLCSTPPGGRELLRSGRPVRRRDGCGARAFCDAVMPGRRATSGPSPRRGRGAGRTGRGRSVPWRVAGCRSSVRRS